MEDEKNTQWQRQNSTGVDQMDMSINEIPGLECIKAWKHHNEYQCVVRTDRDDLERVVKEIKTVLRSRNNIEIRDENILFAVKSSDIDNPESRIELLSVKTQSTHSGYSVEVTLRYSGNTVTGQAEGGLDIEERTRIAGEATRVALTKLILREGKLGIKEIERVNVKNKEIFISLLTLSYGGEKIHCGAAIKRFDDCEAVVRATLDAVNRYIDDLMKN